MEPVEYTHYAKFHTVPCYFNVYTGEIAGRSKFYDVILGVMVWIDCVFPSHELGFPIAIGEKLEDGNKYH